MQQTKYVTYIRVSTKKQGESGLGLQSQQTYLDHFYNGKNIIAEFTENVSGKDISNRPKLQQALALCKKEKAVLVVAKIDRLSRNTEQALWIYAELDGRLESCDIPNLDKFTLTLFMAIADRERELISLRTANALAEKTKRQGEWRKASTPFTDKTANHLAVAVNKNKARANENNKRAAALIQLHRQQNKAWKEIALELNNAGFKASRGGAFQAVQVQRIYERLAST
ncbi:recombinase family protein [Adhaeribacter rhizoryzae]|uniref:Recombinase family protein n=1 Tax=Adhaeribacter rhizoryzae TaxID=2607907 RepID=A0A5M6CXJ0_9BACT|nr:recombinase family protein [Adhaeribacter rhizoryzae]KAA5539120.1 recombinase family protein [Adhaeribacter rhizoryzae]